MVFKVSFKKWYCCHHWRTWGIPKSSGIAHSGSIGSCRKGKQQFVLFSCSVLVKMPHDQQVLTWDLDSSGGSSKNAHVPAGRNQDQCWLCAKYATTVYPQLWAVQHLITKTAQWESRMDLFRAPEESPNKRTCWFKCFSTLECGIAWPSAVPFDGMSKRLQSADRHHLCWTHLPNLLVGFCMRMLLLNSCFLTAWSCSRTRWSWRKGMGSLQTQTRVVSVPRFARTKVVKAQPQEELQNAHRRKASP